MINAATAALPEKTTDVLAFIKEFIAKNEMPPTYREIAAGLGYRSAAGPYWHVARLENYGLLRVSIGIARSIVIL